MATASSSHRPVPSTKRSARSPESNFSLQKRNAAAEILQSYEKLSWMSFHRCETITQTRLHYQRVIAGLDNDAEGKGIRWKEDFTRHPKADDDGKSSRKGKDRASLGSSGGGKESSGSKIKGKESPKVGESSEQAVKEA